MRLRHVLAVSFACVFICPLALAQFDSTGDLKVARPEDQLPDIPIPEHLRERVVYKIA